MGHHGWRHYLLLFVRGLAMGAADVVPGVSGGTIAFITGIYEELIDSLRRIDHRALLCLIQRGPIAAWNHINGNFLLCVFGGVLCSLLSLAKIISFCLETYPVMVWSFFFGLILASIFHLARDIEWRRPSTAIMFAIGAIIALAISVARPASLPADWWMVMISGSIAICAMILPGISGSFILLLMGMYSVFLQAINDLNVGLLASFMIGCVLGLLIFSHVLSWLLRHYHGQTLALLSGFLLGSLNVIWPWKQVVETRINRHGEEVPFIQHNISPWAYETIVGQASQWGQALLLMLAGLFVVLIIEWAFMTLKGSQTIDGV